MGTTLSKAERQEKIDYMTFLVSNLETMLKNIKDKPTWSETARYNRETQAFRETYASLIKGRSSDPDAEQLLTRFAKFNLAWSKMERPQVYAYPEGCS